MYMKEALLQAIFAGDAQHFLKEGEELQAQEIGALSLPTGRIVANDPCCLFETEPFVQAVRPGRYAVRLFVLHANHDRRVAFAAVCFSEQLPRRFEMALTQGQEIGALEDDEFYGYGVDSGTGAFMDAATCAVYEKVAGTEDAVFAPLDQALEESYVPTYSVANVPLEAGGNIVAFSSGWGDGCYPSYWGFDEAGEVCCLVTDFCIVD